MVVVILVMLKILLVDLCFTHSAEILVTAELGNIIKKKPLVVVVRANLDFADIHAVAVDSDAVAFLRSR